jgi:hypothetical protein|tara:strand:+ start:274 stop:513 length:240 start_codon:yes stop_codon:yes gene_type:complete
MENSTIKLTIANDALRMELRYLKGYLSPMHVGDQGRKITPQGQQELLARIEKTLRETELSFAGVFYDQPPNTTESVYLT